ncbi:galactan beta-1,4-galactosyltransferase GALS1 [Malania oleifera]|uniref:galactan beta-1,4-galactosyltransferase GALS1 n=1 Tax=Malania oleifera TaxID=397392 RepID=UPI0025AE79FB|nr:galactan beta-1,4-galactosyltransferase GALS1 [Malania oleifera]
MSALPMSVPASTAGEHSLIVSTAGKMRKEAAPPTAAATTVTTVAKLSHFFEAKPLAATLLSLTLLMLIWNLQPFYENLLSSTAATAPCCSSTISTLNNTATAADAPAAAAPASDIKYMSSKTAIPNADPNKRVFQAYGNAASLFVQMGAYRGGDRTFAVVGLASKPLHVFGSPWYKCEYISNINSNNSSNSMKAKAYKMLPDWGYGRVYTVVVVNCTFQANPNADNSGGKLILYAYYGASPKRYEKIAALEEAPGSYDESKYRPPYQYEYVYCGSSLYGNVSAARMKEWMAYHAWFFGERSHFVFHDAGGVSAVVRAALEPWVRAGRATVQDIRGQSEFDGYYYNQFLVVNDCLHRYRHSANWTFFFDVDEYMYLPDGNTLDGVLKEFSGYTQFTIEQNAMSSALCLNDSTEDYSREWGFEKLVFRDSRTRIRRDRKYAIQAKNAYATGVHMSENVIGKTLHKTETKIRYYHYHNSITVPGELCRQFLPASFKNRKETYWLDKVPFVYDDGMKKLTNTIKDFESRALGTLQQLYS